MSTWPTGQQPLILLNRGRLPDRERFTLAHEVGHLLMHELPADDQEKEADRFAGEFLAPAEELEPLLWGWSKPCDHPAEVAQLRRRREREAENSLPEQRREVLR
ncbi:ImmA/IrrE family metallo-endopeptidase [Amycolatopsis sp. cmx-4-68]|uniref:ImmA/IrrE family metallo-endopeptidase n=1 Tax=Amycolatopsis sp. cmx-4-68 TaxID=2790938 RepID=UPI00397E7601